MPVDYDDIVKWALELPDVEEALAYGKPCVKRAGRMMLAPSREEGAATFKLDWETHDRLLEEKPKIYFKTPHYEGWPWILARMPKLTEKETRMLIQNSWDNAPKPAKVRKN